MASHRQIKVLLPIGSRIEFTEFGTWSSADKFIASRGGCWLLIITYTRNSISVFLFSPSLTHSLVSSGIVEQTKSRRTISSQVIFVFYCRIYYSRMVYEAVSLHRVSRTKWNSYVNYVLVLLPRPHVWIALSRCAKNLYKSHCVRFITFVWYIAQRTCLNRLWRCFCVCR